MIIASGKTLKIEKVGYAGGYVGHMVGGQIWGNRKYLPLTDVMHHNNQNTKNFVLKMMFFESFHHDMILTTRFQKTERERTKFLIRRSLWKKRMNFVCRRLRGERQ